MTTPRIRRVLETALYVDDLERAAGFYVEVLGLRVMAKGSRLVALDAGAGTVLLLFRRGATAGGARTPGGWIPPHDGRGPAHFALAIDADELGAWRARLEAHGVEVDGEVVWPRGGTSLYFRDPDGHSVEVVTPGVWPVY